MAARNSKKGGHVQPGPTDQPSVNDIARANSIVITGRGPRQIAYLQSLKTNPLTVALGPLGTGKTWLAAGMAAKGLLSGRYKRFIMTRAAVAVDGEDHGFRPGDIGKKTAHWARPVIEALIDHTKSPAVVEKWLKEKTVEFLPFGDMRGLTLPDAFIIVDEAQNTTRRQMELLCGRLGEGVTVVICGDFDQCDLTGKALEASGGESGLEALVNMLEGRGLAQTVEFTVDDIQRSQLAKALAIGWQEYGHAQAA